MAPHVERILSWIFAGCAVLITGSVVHREFISGSGKGGRPQAVFQGEWEKALPIGTVIGQQSARVKLVIFTDLECPGCANYHNTIREVLRERPNEVSAVLVHFPLTSHKFALPAARAAECAKKDNRFADFVDLIYAKQDSLGIKSWASYASEIGIADTVTFRRCVLDAAPVKSIDAGRELGARFGVKGTPTLFANGWSFGPPPRKEQLRLLIDALLAGKTPDAVGL